MRAGFAGLRFRGVAGGARPAPRVRAATGVVVYTRAMFRALVLLTFLLIPGLAGAQEQAPTKAGAMTDFATPETDAATPATDSTPLEEPEDPNDPFTAGTAPVEEGLGFGTTLLMLTQMTKPQEPIVPHVPVALRRKGPKGL